VSPSLVVGDHRAAGSASVEQWDHTTERSDGQFAPKPPVAPSQEPQAGDLMRTSTRPTFHILLLIRASVL